MRWEGEAAPNIGSRIPLALPVSHFVTMQVFTPLVALSGTSCVTPPFVPHPFFMLPPCNLEHISDLLLESWGLLQITQFTAQYASIHGCAIWEM